MLTSKGLKAYMEHREQNLPFLSMHEIPVSSIPRRVVNALCGSSIVEDVANSIRRFVSDNEHYLSQEARMKFEERLKQLERLAERKEKP